MLDTIIRGGNIIDGTNRKKYLADVGIKKDRIVKVGNLGQATAQNVIEANGKLVTPGFIDIHNHSDGYWTLFNYPDLPSLIMQGVTTIIGGGSGTSLAPLATPETIQAIRRWTNVSEITVNWLTVGDLLEEIERLPLSVNFGTLIGHITLKRGLIGDQVRDFNAEEYRTAEGMLARGMKEGAFGLSAGMSYSHARFAKTEEIIRLAKVAAKYSGIFTISLRSETGNLIESVREAVKICRQAGISTEVTQFKAKGRENWDKFSEAINVLNKAAEEKLNVNFDIYPYSTTGTVLYTYLPDWATRGGRDKMLERLKNPNIRPKVVEEMKADVHDYSNLVIAMSSNLAYVGKEVVSIGEDENIDSEEVVINTLIASDGQAICFDPALSEENVKQGLANPLSMISTDGSGYDDTYSQTGNLVHPRCFGTFPRFLGRYVREQQLMSWEEAIYKITGMVARKLGLKDRGFIKKDLQADIVVFNPEVINDQATFANPYRYPIGISTVLVNGVPVVQRENPTGQRPGQVLRHSK
ncbi:amidohydrolase family protein [Patescibacteria group bacterium]